MRSTSAAATMVTTVASTVAVGSQGDEEQERQPSMHDSAELMALVRAGDPAAETALFERFAPLVNNLAWKILGSDPDLADVVHDVFIRIYRGVLRLREAERLNDWVVKVTINTITNELRRRRFRRWVSWDTAHEGTHPETETDLDGRELLRRTYHALTQLPAADRVVLSVRLFETGSVEEIARLCSCSTRTAKRRLQRARLRFESIAMRDPLLAGRLKAGGPSDSLAEAEVLTLGERA